MVVLIWGQACSAIHKDAPPPFPQEKETINQTVKAMKTPDEKILDVSIYWENY